MVLQSRQHPHHYLFEQCRFCYLVHAQSLWISRQASHQSRADTTKKQQTTATTTPHPHLRTDRGSSVCPLPYITPYVIIDLAKTATRLSLEFLGGNNIYRQSGLVYCNSYSSSGKFQTLLLTHQNAGQPCRHVKALLNKQALAII